jgi:hypothetical protein
MLGSRLFACLFVGLFVRLCLGGEVCSGSGKEDGMSGGIWTLGVAGGRGLDSSACSGRVDRW